MQELFNRLPIPDEVEAFQITSRFWKEVMENDKEPPPYTHIRRNVFLIKKKRDDFDDGVSCSCHIDDTQVCGEDCECRVQSMSCSKSCECRDKCTNKPFRKERRVKVVKTEHCGWGAEACEAIERGEFIIEYTGEVIDDATCEKRLWEMKGRSVHNFYMCEIAKDFIIDATYKGNPSRYLNHSCQPNCKLEKWRVDGETRVGVFALIDIQVGEPLTYNYKFIDYGMKVICRCGAANCRGAIGEKFGSSTMKSKAGSEPLTVWGARKKRSCLQNRFQNHIRYAVSHQNYRKPARAS